MNTRETIFYSVVVLAILAGVLRMFSCAEAIEVATKNAQKRGNCTLDAVAP